MNAQKLPFSTRMRELRKEKGWKQIDLAEKAGIDKNMISYYENGKYIPSADALMKIAEAFDVSLDYLLTEKESLKNIIESLVTKNQITELATRAS